MRPPKQAQTTYRALLVAFPLCCLLALTALTHPADAARTSKKQLQQRKVSIQSKIGQVQKELRAVKAKERRTRTQLYGVQHRVRVARGQLHVANTRLHMAKAELNDANTALRHAKRTFAETQVDVGNRLVASYEQGEHGSMEFLFSAKDFSELLDRAQLVQFMREQDRDALEDLKRHKDQVAKYQRRVQGKTQEVAIWRQQVALLHQRTVMEHYQVNEKLTDVRDTRATYEAEYAALMRDSAEITAMLRRMQSTASGRKRYNRTYAGGVGGLPVAGRITSPFGWRIHPIAHTRRMHTGLDIAAPTGTPIHAAGGGEVIYAGRRGGYGNTVMIDHGRGKTTLYGHMSAISVHVGQVVSRGQVVGRVGSTGFSTGPHCHYEVRMNGSPVNPL